MAHSDVAHLKQRIAEEYRAAQWGLSGLSYGSARHDVIEAHMERMGQYQKQLITLMGEDPAMALVVETLNAQPSAPMPPGSEEAGGNHS